VKYPVIGLTLLGLFVSTSLFGQSLFLAAASTREAVDDVVAGFAQQSRVAIPVSFASSSTLARQVALGAPAGVFLSANTSWMDYLEKAGFLKPNTKVAFLTNHLVLIAPLGTKLQPNLPFNEYFGKTKGRLALGDPRHVPAGQYAQAALILAKSWEAAQTRLAPTANVRMALALVERGECPLGIVYQTDADASDKVVVLRQVPSPKPIEYSLALLKGASSEASRFYGYLTSPQGKFHFATHGFEPL